MGYSDDMMGLAMYGDDGMGAWMSGRQLQEYLMAAGAGGLGILATSAVLQRIPYPADWQPSTVSRLKNVVALGVGIVGGRLMYDRNRDAAMGFMGGVSGLAFAQLLQSFAPDTLSTSLSGGGLSSADLAALEAAVATNSPSWRAGEMAGLRGPVVSDRALASTGTTQEELAEYDRYMGGGGVIGAAPPPSF